MEMSACKKDFLLFVFSAILTAYIARCWILRLPCKTESKFEVKVQGHILRNCLIGERTVTSVKECFENCEIHSKCKSINHKEGGEKNCQLNDKLKEMATDNDFVANAAWTYYTTNYNTSNIGTFCEDYTPCPPGPYCIDTCRCPGYQCIRCDPGYSFNYDLQCTDMNECNSNPCKNGGNCENHVNKFNCVCLPGYAGVLCEVDINECASNPCQNGATCSDNVNSYQCSCLPGYSGVHCEVDINECASNPCQNGATCNDNVNSYQCNCVPGYSGVRCEVDINECASNPCQNGATCYNNVNSYQCRCLAGYNGVRCEFDIDECSSNPCRNGAICHNHINSFSCTCKANYYGTFCETKSYQSCDSIYAEGTRSNGAKTLSIGTHYCLLDGTYCGQGGWTLAMKVKGSKKAFKSDSKHWTTYSTHQQERTGISENDAKFRAFNELSFSKVCLVMRKNGGSTYRSLVVNYAGSSLLAIFKGGQVELGQSRQVWLDLLPGSQLQPNCNRNGFNLRKDRSERILLRFGIMGNNENECRSPDSFIGIGMDDSYISVTAGNEYHSKSVWAMSYLFVK